MLLPSVPNCVRWARRDLCPGRESGKRLSIASCLRGRLRRGEQPLLGDHGYGQDLVTDVIEQHGQLLAFVAQNGALTPLRVVDPAVYRVRPLTLVRRLIR